MNILVILKGIADGTIKNNTRLVSTSQLSDDLFVYRNKLYFIDHHENLFELFTDDIVELIDDNILFMNGGLE